MKCRNCEISYSSREMQCPFCGTPNPKKKRTTDQTEGNVHSNQPEQYSGELQSHVKSDGVYMKTTTVYMQNKTEGLPQNRDTENSRSNQRRKRAGGQDSLVNSRIRQRNSKIMRILLLCVTFCLLISIGVMYYIYWGKAKLDWKWKRDEILAQMDSYYENDQYKEIDALIEKYQIDSDEIPKYYHAALFNRTYMNFIYDRTCYLQKSYELEYAATEGGGLSPDGLYNEESLAEKKAYYLRQCISTGFLLKDCDYMLDMGLDQELYQDTCELINAIWIGDLGMSMEDLAWIEEQDYVLSEDEERIARKIENKESGAVD